TRDTTGITTTGAYQENVAGHATESSAFLVRFDTAGQRLWGTYYTGTSGYTPIEGGIAVDGSGNIFIAASTNTSDGMGTVGAHQELPGGGMYDACLGKFDSTGQLQWST